MHVGLPEPIRAFIWVTIQCPESQLVNILSTKPNNHDFADDIFKCISLNENVLISLKISLKFVPKARIKNIPPLVPIVAWRRPGDKPLSESEKVSPLTHICVTRPQWVKWDVLQNYYSTFILSVVAAIVIVLTSFSEILVENIFLTWISQMVLVISKYDWLECCQTFLLYNKLQNMTADMSTCRMAFFIKGT